MKHNFRQRYITYRLFNYSIFMSLILAINSTPEQHEIAFNIINDRMDNE